MIKLGITSIQHNRAPWIKEWVAFHSLVGFKKFYVYLHKCADTTQKILTGLKKNFDIEIFTVDQNLEAPQLWCYQDSYIKHGDKVDWMAFIDSDEFLFPTSADSMEHALKEFSDKKLSALGVYWSCFGSNGFIKEPPGLMIQNYKYRAADGYHNNRHIKSLVKGGLREFFLAPDNPHFFKTPLGTYDENLRPITKGWTDYEPTYNKFRINHYATQSRSFFVNVKSKFIMPDGAATPDESFWEEHDKNEVFDHSMDKFIEPLKDILSLIGDTDTQMIKIIDDGHLGGYVEGGDEGTYTPRLWDTLIADYDIKSVVDIGCGEGHASKYFADKGIEVLAIDGSKKVLATAVYQPIIIHDYYQGAYIPDRVYDLSWCCEFLEHIDEEYIPNFMATFKKSKIAAVTHALPGQEGYHHVNERDDAYWIEQFKKYGFEYSKADSLKYRSLNEATYFPISGMIFLNKEL